MQEETTYGIGNVLNAAYARHRDNTAGAAADYIPELAAVDPNRFGIAVATVNGALHKVGDADYPFTIQSISKAFVYCLALELIGRDAVLERVGVEPSGDAFNAFVFDPQKLNPGRHTLRALLYDDQNRFIRATTATFTVAAVQPPLAPLPEAPATPTPTPTPAPAPTATPAPLSETAPAPPPAEPETNPASPVH